MGTSTKYEAPTFGEWRRLKLRVTRLVTQDESTPDHIRKIVEIFVKGDAPWSWVTDKGEDGDRGQAALKVAQNIGDFFALITDLGFSESFKRVDPGLPDKKTVSQIKNLLFVHLNCPGNKEDEIDARNALLCLLDEIFKNVDTFEEVEDMMQAQSTDQSLIITIQRFFGYYLCEQFRRMFHEPILKKGKIPEKANEDVHKIRECIWSTVENIISNGNLSHIEVSHINWNGDQGYQTVNNIFQEIRQRTQEVLADEN